jgi:hypothetical protein
MILVLPTPDSPKRTTLHDNVFEPSIRLIIKNIIL